MCIRKETMNNIFRKVIAFAIVFAPFLTKAACFVRADVDCPGNTVAWSPKDALTRSKLLYSAEVQSNSQSCNLYAALIKAECNIKDPIQSVFIDAKGASTTYFSAADMTSAFKDPKTLPLDFQKYFADNGTQLIMLENLQVTKDFTAQQQTTLMDFVSAKNQTTVLTLPGACDSFNQLSVDFSRFNRCGYRVQCGTKTNLNVGVSIVITKMGASDSENVTCTAADALQSIIDDITTIQGTDDPTKILSYKVQPTVANFSAFKNMPSISQTDGWIQGLSLDKYGVNYVKPGICLGTSMTMMALGLKDTSVGSWLGNGFDVAPNSYGDGVAWVRDPSDSNKSVQKQYSHYATYVDEMLRAGGLVTGSFPALISQYKNFFESPLVQDPMMTAIAFAGGSPLGSYEHFLAHKTIQLTVMQNFRAWIAGRKGIVLALQSTGVTQGATPIEGRVGHANVVTGFSGFTLLLLDPWGVVSQARFSNYVQGNAGQVMRTFTQAEVDACRRDTPAQYVSLCPKKAGDQLVVESRVYSALTQVGTRSTTDFNKTGGYIGLKLASENSMVSGQAASLQFAAGESTSYARYTAAHKFGDIVVL